MESLRQATQNKLQESERTRERLEADNIELYTKLRSSPLPCLHVSYHSSCRYFQGGNDQQVRLLDEDTLNLFSSLHSVLSDLQLRDMILRQEEAPQVAIMSV